MGHGFDANTRPGTRSKHLRTADRIADLIQQHGGVPIWGLNDDGTMARSNTRNGAKLGRGNVLAGLKQLKTMPAGAGAAPGTTSVPPGEQATPVDAGNNNPQQATAKLIGAVQGNSFIPPEFTAALQQGQVPAIGLLTPRAWRNMTPTMRALYASLLESTGWVGDLADIDDAIERNRPA
jgi:hypothetical protein